MPKKFQVKVVAASADKSAEILIHGPIGKSWWSDEGISGKEFTDALNANPGKITVGVNSQGGAVGEGLAIFNAIKRRAADVTVRIDGYALSIASFFPLAAGKIISPKSSIWMIHRAWSFAKGNANEMRKTADMLETHDDTLIQGYVEKTGKSRKDIESALDEETWLTGEEAVDWGLADEHSDDPVTVEDLGEAAYAQFKKPHGFLEALAKTQELYAPAAMASISRYLVKGASPTGNNPPANSGAENHPTDPMKEKIIAVLKKHGVTVADNATDETVLAELDKLVKSGKVTKEEKEQLTAPAATNVVSLEAFNALQARLDAQEKQAAAERKARIASEVNALIADRPSQDAELWIGAALADEKALDRLRAKPVESIGAPPVGFYRLENCGNPAIEAYNKLDLVDALAPDADGKFTRKVKSGNKENATKRIAFRRANMGALIRAYDQFMPQAANTISSTLKPDALIDALIVIANNRLAPVRAFSRLFTTDTLRPGAAHQIKQATAGSTGQSNPTSWESGNSTLAPISATPAHKTQSFHVSQSDRNYGFDLDDVAQVNADAFANLLSDVYTAIMTTANYGTALAVGVAGTFDADDLKPVLAAAKNYRAKNLLLDGGHLAFLLPTDKFQFALGEQGAYGFDLIAAQNRWTSAATNACGFVCSPDALAVVAGMPANTANKQFDLYGSFMIAELGLSVLYTSWFNTDTRIQWASYELMFGAGAGDTTQAEVLVTA